MRPPEEIAKDILECALSWDPEVRLIGNVTATEIAELANFCLRKLECAHCRCSLIDSEELALCEDCVGWCERENCTGNECLYNE